MWLWRVSFILGETMKTLIIEYSTDRKKQEFQEENKSILGQFDVIFVKNNRVDGVVVSALPN